MKKIMILATGIVFATSAYAQNIAIAPEVGLNLANMQRKFFDEKQDNGIKLGVKVGANVNIPVGDRLVIQPGLFYSIKGFKSDRVTHDSFFTTVDKNNTTLHYAEIPVNIQYMFNDANEGRFFIGVGPYVGIAFSGKNISRDTSGRETTEDLKFGSDASQDLGRFDYGAGVNAGYFLRSGIFFRAMYQMSIGNLVPSEIRQDNSQRNSVITISLGYQIGGRPEASPSRRQKAKADEAM